MRRKEISKEELSKQDINSIASKVGEDGIEALQANLQQFSDVADYFKYIRSEQGTTITDFVLDFPLKYCTGFPCFHNQSVLIHPKEVLITMRSRFTFIILMFAGIFAICGCGNATESAESVPLTQPTETVIYSNENTIPSTAQTEPQELTMEDAFPGYSELIQAEFEHFHGIPYLNKAGEVKWEGKALFRYVGAEDQIHFPGNSIVLTLPEGWADNVTVVYSGTNIRLYNNFIWDAQTEFWASMYPDKTIETLDDPYYDYMLIIKALPHSFFEENQDHFLKPDPHNPFEGIYVGEDINFVYWAVIAGDEYYDNERYHVQRLLIEKIGQDAYDALVGNLVVQDYEMVQDMITLSTQTHP